MVFLRMVPVAALTFAFGLSASAGEGAAFPVNVHGMFDGSFTISTVHQDPNGVPDTDAFEHLSGQTLQFSLSFDSVMSEIRGKDSDDNPLLTIVTGPAHIVLSGDPTGYLQDVVLPGFTDEPLRLSFFVRPSGKIFLNGFNVVSPEGAEYFGFNLGPGTVSMAIDEEGYPVLSDFHSLAIGVILRRYTSPPFLMTDYAFGPADFQFTDEDIVAVKSASMGQIKAHFGSQP